MENYFNTEFVVCGNTGNSIVSSWLNMNDFNTVEEIYEELKSQGFKAEQLQDSYIEKIYSLAPIIDSNSDVKTSLVDAFHAVKAFDETIKKSDYAVGDETEVATYADLFYAILEVKKYTDLLTDIENGDLNKYQFKEDKIYEDLVIDIIEEIKNNLSDYTKNLFSRLCDFINFDKFIEEELSNKYAQTEYGVIRID